MRTLTTEEVEMVSGSSEAPLGPKTAGEYFSKCMEYTNPSATLGAGLGALSLFPRFGWLGVATSAWGIGTAVVCGIGTLQYAQ